VFYSHVQGGGLQFRSNEAKALKVAQEKEKPASSNKSKSIHALPAFAAITAGKAVKPPASASVLSPALMEEYAEEANESNKLRPPKVDTRKHPLLS